MAPHSSTLPGKSHGWRSLVGCSPWGCEESDTAEQLHFHFSLPCIGEGTGTPLQCSCLENPRDGEPGGLPSLGWHRVGHDWSDLAVAAAVYVTAVSLPSVAPWRSWFDHTGTRTFPHRTWRNWWWELHMCSRMRKKLVFCSSPLIPWL